MKKRILNYLRCPKCNDALSLTIFEDKGEEIVEGMLLCQKHSIFPIIDSIPRLLPGVLKYYPDFNKKYEEKIKQYFKEDSGELNVFKKNFLQTQRRFEFQWLKWGDQNVIFGHTKEEDTRRILQMLPRGMTPKNLEGKLILDAGCGHGRYSEIFGEMGAEVIAFDLGNGVEVARKRTKHLDNVHVVQGNIMELPFTKNTFDFIWSFGVIHHTPDTRMAFKKLAGAVKQDGYMSIWVYPKESSVWELSQKLIRGITTNLHPRILYGLCYMAVPLLYFVKTYSNTNPKRNTWKQCAQVIYDWYSPKYQTHHTEEEISQWYADDGFIQVETLPIKTGVCGRKIQPQIHTDDDKSKK